LQATENHHLLPRLPLRGISMDNRSPSTRSQKPHMHAINRYCPRSGKPVAEDSLTDYQGHTVGFCNPGCRDDFATQTAADPQACAHDRGYFDALIREA
jgi:hypothetical protein